LSGTTPTANLVGGLGVDDVLTRTDGTGTRAFLTDGLGSTLSLVDGNGVKQTSYTYDAFGGTSISGQTNANSQQYTGRENDGTGLYSYRARYYSPSLGRFISEDPIGFAGGLNQYAYVGNDPVNAIDPSGTCGVDAILDFAFIGYDLYRLAIDGRISSRALPG
jgi:RHS repeat-associated protein